MVARAGRWVPHATCLVLCACGTRPGTVDVEEPGAPPEGGVSLVEAIDVAEKLLAEGKLGTAEEILEQVVASVPDGWSFCTETDEAVSCAFYNMAQFLSFTVWYAAEHPDTEKEIVWEQGAYSKAWYLLGYISVERQDLEKALWALGYGLGLEPDSPTILGELGFVMVALGDMEHALKSFDAAMQRPWATGLERARALRGRGVVLIEMGRLDEAQAALEASLELEPGNPLAVNELIYIEQLRAGGSEVPLQVYPE
jgi:tetratricopeptide (TPR) repeat protein